MTDRERLIELIDDYRHEIKFCGRCDRPAEDCEGCENEQIAEYLLANGVVVPLCNVGDTVYILAGHNGRKYEKDICEGFYIGYDGVVQVRVRNTKGNHGTYGVIGQTVFLTKEEAEKALEGMSK